MIWWCRSDPINFSMPCSQIADLNLTLCLFNGRSAEPGHHFCTYKQFEKKIRRCNWGFEPLPLPSSHSGYASARIRLQFYQIEHARRIKTRSNFTRCSVQRSFCRGSAVGRLSACGKLWLVAFIVSCVWNNVGFLSSKFTPNPGCPRH